MGQYGAPSTYSMVHVMNGVNFKDLAVDLRAQLDAQRLRADTAEAERDSWKDMREQSRLRNAKLRKKLTAAEQRIAELKSALEGMLEYFPEGHSDGECFSVEAARSALNQKSEGESNQIARDALKMENQRIVPARFKCLACGDCHEGSGNLPCPNMVATSVTLKTGAYKKRED